MGSKRYPGNAVIDKYMILFKRFLKERGQYTFIINLMFKKPKRSMEDFYKDVEKMYSVEYICYDFGDILHIAFTLGQEHRRLGHGFWNAVIKPISNDWEIYFDEHKDDIENG